MNWTVVYISIILKVFAGGLYLPDLASWILFSLLLKREFESQAIEVLCPLAKCFAFKVPIIVIIIKFSIFRVLLDKLFIDLI